MSDADVHIALIRESDSVVRPTKVVTLEAHLAALQEQARAATTAALALPIHFTHQE